MKAVPVLAATISLGAVAAGPAVASGQSPDGPVFDGTWLYRRAEADGVSTAIQIQGSAMLYLEKEGHDYTFTRGWWTVNPYANPDDKGVYHVVTRGGEPAIEGAPQLDAEPQELRIRMIDRDKGEVRFPDEESWSAAIERIECDLAVSYVDRSDPPPRGCQWAEIRGLGYDGLTGECVWKEEWADSWDALDRDSEGNPSQMACLLSEPVSFPIEAAGSGAAPQE